MRIADLLVADTRADLRDAVRLSDALAKAQPEVVIHMAAQSLVRESYRAPLETISVNVLGTAHLLDAACATGSVRALVNVTTDKCYDNVGWIFPYRETDALGGKDIYSASKACAELVTTAWRKSFGNSSTLAMASARAGNVIGGGDWAQERLLPDCMRAFAKNEAATLRYPDAVRPWQHVLEPLMGYMALAQALLRKDEGVESGWNFGPDLNSEVTVLRVAETAAHAWGAGAIVQVSAAAPDLAEAKVLRLDSTKAALKLGWAPRWTIERAIDETVAWHKARCAGQDVRATALAQIGAYLEETS
jgi:CDP-glucose 4,6-dehydratase